jgi:biopolymer transport protein ExbD
MNFKRRYGGAEPGFQLAPMLDLMFQLLLFFMVAAVYAHLETKMGITVPTADSGLRGSRQPGEIIINLDEAGSIFVNNVQMSLDRLGSLLGQVARTYQEQPVIIRADAKTRHEAVIGVLDTCRKADIWNIAFATLPPKAGQE